MTFNILATFSANSTKIFALNAEKEFCEIDLNTYKVSSNCLIPEISDNTQLYLTTMKQIYQGVIVLGGFKKETQKDDYTLPFKTTLIFMYGDFDDKFNVTRTSEYVLPDTIDPKESILPAFRFEFLKEKYRGFNCYNLF